MTLPAAREIAEPRPLWRPSPADRISAAETLLASSLPYPARLVVRELYETWAAERPEMSKGKAA